MFASIGTISFQVVASPTKMETDQKYHYEKIKVIGAPPILQWIYDDLRRVRLSIFLHQLWCNPDAAVAGIQALASTHQAQNFVFGNGKNYGSFVVQNLQLKQEWQADNGNTIAIAAELELEEFVASALPIGAPPSAAVLGLAPGLTTTQFKTPGATLVVSPASAYPSSIPFQQTFTNIPLTEIARLISFIPSP